MPTASLQDQLLHRWRYPKERWSMTPLNGVDLHLGEGEMVGIQGANGSGKTTFLRILAGLMRFDAGTVECRGRICCFFDLGTGFQTERTARENIMLFGLLHGMTRDQVRDVYGRIIAMAGIHSHADVPVKCYSTGMLLRLGFASAMHVDADIYLLDEIIAVGDKQFQERCLQELRTMKAKGKSAILASHDLGGLQETCDRLLCLTEGRLTAEEKVASFV